MKTATLAGAGLGVLALVVWLRAVEQAGSENSAAAITAMEAQQAAEREAAERRAKDPAWQPACREVGTIQIGNPEQPGALRNYCLNARGEILACFAPALAAPRIKPGEVVPPQPGTARRPSPSEPAGIRVYSPDGQCLRTLPLDISPEAIAVAPDETIYVGGSGKLLKLDPAGRVLASVATPVADAPVSLDKELLEELKKEGADFETRRQDLLNRMELRRAQVTGLAVTDHDVFAAVPAPNDFTYRVYRFTRELTEPKLIVEKLRGCCGQMDLQTHAGNLWIAHNARHSVECRDRDGQLLSKFGKAGRVRAPDFGGCCEPKNLRVLANGEILAAESGPPTCIKRFSADGKFLEVLALLESPGDCVRVTVARSPDGARFYLLDTTRDAIRIFAPKG